ncbi:hypothetical protein K3495_g16453, partial [Podosphaera aphanis]
MWHPVAFHPRTLSGPEENYKIHDKELLAIIQCLKEWRAELTSVLEPFLILTNHRALEYFGQKQLLNDRQIRWSEVLSQFRFDLQYRPGKENILADALSRKKEPTLLRRGEWRLRIAVYEGEESRDELRTKGTKPSEDRSQEMGIE